MKRLPIVILSSLLTVVSYGQIKWPAMWKAGQTKTINGHQIQKESGDGTPFLAWETSAEFISHLEAKAKKELWPADSLEKFVSYVNEHQPGGTVKLKIVRHTIHAGNLDKFTVVIFDNEGK